MSHIHITRMLHITTENADEYRNTHVRESQGSIAIDADVGCFRCLSIKALGSIRAGGGLEAVGSIEAGGAIRGESIRAGENIRAGWSIEAGGAIEAGESIEAGEGIGAGGVIKVGEPATDDEWRQGIELRLAALERR